MIEEKEKYVKNLTLKLTEMKNNKISLSNENEKYLKIEYENQIKKILEGFNNTIGILKSQNKKYKNSILIFKKNYIKKEIFEELQNSKNKTIKFYQIKLEEFEKKFLFKNIN